MSWSLMVRSIKMHLRFNVLLSFSFEMRRVFNMAGDLCFVGLGYEHLTMCKCLHLMNWLMVNGTKWLEFHLSSHFALMLSPLMIMLVVVTVLVISASAIVLPVLIVNNSLWLIMSSTMMIVVDIPSVHRGSLSFMVLYGVVLWGVMLWSMVHWGMVGLMMAWIISVAVKWKHVHFTFMLNSMLGLRLNCLEEIIVFVLNVMHQLSSFMKTEIVALEAITMVNRTSEVILFPSIIVRLVLVIIITVLVVYDGTVAEVFAVNLVSVVLWVQLLMVLLLIDTLINVEYRPISGFFKVMILSISMKVVIVSSCLVIPVINTMNSIVILVAVFNDMLTVMVNFLGRQMSSTVHIGVQKLFVGWEGLSMLVVNQVRLLMLVMSLLMMHSLVLVLIWSGIVMRDLAMVRKVISNSFDTVCLLMMLSRTTVKSLLVSMAEHLSIPSWVTALMVGIMERFPLISLGESIRVSTVLHMPEVGVLVILVLEMALVLLLEDIVVLVRLSELLTKGGLMLIGGLRLDRDHLCGTVVLSGVQRLWNIRLHLQH